MRIRQLSMLQFSRRRRGISPVVSTIFLFGVIIGGISVSLGIIYPQVQQLNDQVLLETSGSALSTIDESIQNLILGGTNSDIRQAVDVGIGGALQYNNLIFSTMRVFDGGVEKLNATINQSRIQIVQDMNSEFLDQGTHQYFGGAGDQSPWFLNDTLRRSLGWSIINQSRAQGSDEVISSLSYRPIITSEINIIPQQLLVNLTINVHMVNITLAPGSAIAKSGTNIGLSLAFAGSRTQITDWTEFSSSLRMVITTEFPEVGTSNAVERPFQAEPPVDESAKFFVRFQFKYHQILLTL